MTLAKTLLGIAARTECTPSGFRSGCGMSGSAIIWHRAPVMSFQLLSSSFAEGGWIPELHSCKGADLSPSLEWSGEPGDVRSFALVVEDPDAPSGTFCHWLVYDIPPDVHNLAQGLKPSSVGVSGTNDFGRLGYGGPCPPEGPAHRYYFRLYALDIDTLGLRSEEHTSELQSLRHLACRLL